MRMVLVTAPMAGPTVVLTGLPGSGKTRLALGVAAALLDAGRDALVVHTDVLKVAARHADPRAPRGAGYAGDFRAKAAALRPWLDAQAEKARRDGYSLVVEGTLALGWRGGLVFRLEVDEAERRRRAARKHATAARALADADLTAFAAALRAEAAIVLDGAAPAGILVAQVLERWGAG